MQSFPRPGMSKAARAGDDRDRLDRLAAALVEHDTLNEVDGIPTQSRAAMWRRRFLNVRTVVAVVVLLSLIAPGLAAIIDAAI